MYSIIHHREDCYIVGQLLVMECRNFTYGVYNPLDYVGGMIVIARFVLIIDYSCDGIGTRYKIGTDDCYKKLSYNVCD